MRRKNSLVWSYETAEEVYNIRMPPVTIRAEAITDRTELRLSDSLRLDVTIIGPAPIRVEPPKEWLADASAGLWKIQPLGSPALNDVPEGQRWSQSFRLDPYVPGTPVPLVFVPVKVNDQEVNLPSFSITVTTTIAKASLEEARPITGMERPPASPTVAGTNPIPIFAVGAIVVVLSFAFLWRRRAKPPYEPTAEERSLAALRELETGRNDFAHILAEILREWLESQGVAAKSSTPSELRAGNSDYEPILSVLERCDRIKFSGEAFAAQEREELRNRVLQFLTPTEPQS